MSGNAQPFFPMAWDVLPSKDPATLRSQLRKLKQDPFYAAIMTAVDELLSVSENDVASASFKSNEELRAAAAAFAAYRTVRDLPEHLIGMAEQEVQLRSETDGEEANTNED